MLPGPLTLRKLVWMAEAKQRNEWNHTAEILAFLADPHRDRKKRRKPYTSDDFHPFRKRDAKLGKATTKSTARKSIMVSPESFARQTSSPAQQPKGK